MYKSHRSFKGLRLGLLCALAILATACQNIPAPKTFNQSAAVAVVSVTQVRQTATILLTANKITKADAQNVQNQADNARRGIEVARVLYKADPVEGQSKLSTVVQGLTLIQQYLASKGGT